MFQATELVYEALLRKDIKCRIREAGGMSMVEVTLSGRNFARASIYYTVSYTHLTLPTTSRV